MQTNFYGGSKVDIIRVGCKGVDTQNNDIYLGHVVSEIPEAAFYNCRPDYGSISLKYVTFENSSALKFIGHDAFRKSALISIEIPASVTEIDGEAFSQCFSLTNVEFEPSSKLQILGKQVFYLSSLLRSMILPKSVQIIGNQVFH